METRHFVEFSPTLFSQIIERIYDIMVPFAFFPRRVYFTFFEDERADVWRKRFQRYVIVVSCILFRLYVFFTILFPERLR